MHMRLAVIKGEFPASSVLHGNVAAEQHLQSLHSIMLVLNLSMGTCLLLRDRVCCTSKRDDCYFQDLPLIALLDSPLSMRCKQRLLHFRMDWHGLRMIH